MILMTLPFAMMHLFSLSMVMVPSNGPWIESRRSRLARFCRSPSPPGRRTMARRRSFSPLPVRSIRIRVSRRPIRPNPYSTTSVGSASRRPLPVVMSVRRSVRNALTSSVPAFAKSFASSPTSILAESRSIVDKAETIGIVSVTRSSRPVIWRANRWARKMPTADSRVSLRPKL